MTYDVFVLPVDRAMTFEAAWAELERRQRTLGFRRGHEAALDPFLAALRRGVPRARSRDAHPSPIDLSIARTYVLVGIPWDRVDEVLAAVAEAAFGTGVAVFDPQRRMVGLPAPFAPAPMSTAGTELYVERASRVLAALGRRAMATPGTDLDLAGGVPEALLSVGLRGRVTATGEGAGAGTAVGRTEDEVPVLTAESKARLAEERRDELVRALGHGGPAERHSAIALLAGWDPDPVVATALRPLLGSDDVYEATHAAAGIARQGDVTDLPALLDAVHRLSPADGASQSTMVGPLRAALALAALAGPSIADGVRERAREWRAAGGRRPAWDREHDAELDALLDG